MFDLTITPPAIVAETSVANILHRQFSLANQTKSPSLKTSINQLQREVNKLEYHCQCLINHKQLQKQHTLHNQVKHGVQQLETQAEQINTLATQLEVEMVKFRETAVKVNQSYRRLQSAQTFKAKDDDELKLYNQSPLNIWEIHNCALPLIVRYGVKFILTTRNVNLFKTREEPDHQRQTKTLQERRKKLEIWLTEQRHQAEKKDILLSKH
ncbi:MAG: hypothetical protein WA919_19680 [Coleofasciculaceae cyanobacterium]